MIEFSLDYPITRVISVRHFPVFVIIGGTVFCGLITMLALVTVGYEYVPFLSASYNSTGKIWYDFLPETTWTPRAKLCQGSVMKVGEGIELSCWISWRTALTTSGILDYTMRSFVDPRTDQYDGMIYSNNPLQNCSVQSMMLSQSAAWMPVDTVEVNNK